MTGPRVSIIPVRHGRSSIGARSAIVAAALACAAALTPACSTSSGHRSLPPAALVERARVSMGSELKLSAWTSDEASAVSAFDAVFAEFDRLESLMSVWRDGSDIVRLNA